MTSNARERGESVQELGAAQEFRADLVVPGHATGRAMVLGEPLSLWGGLDSSTGHIIDVHHPQHGLCVSGHVLVLPFGRGSSSASSVLTEAIRCGTAPCAFVVREPDEILALGSLVAEELYGTITPIAVLDQAHYDIIRHGAPLRVTDTSVIQG